MKSDNKDIIYGIHPIIELIKAKKRKIYEIYTTKSHPKMWHEIEKLLPAYVIIKYVLKEQLNKLAGTTDHQGVIAFVSPLIIRKKFFSPEKEKFLIMLDGIQDPRNLGAILRSAYCTGVDGVIITIKASAPITAAAIKASAGLSEHLDIYLATSAKSAVLELQNAGYKIYISTFLPQPNAQEIDYNLPLCVVIGSEGTGVSKNILKDGIQVTLPQRTCNISYNASVAAGILLFLISTKNKII